MRRPHAIAIGTTVCLATVLVVSTRAQRGGSSEPAPQAPSARVGDRASTSSTSKGGEQDAPPPAPQVDLTPAERAAQYFAIADYDANGWITFTEAQKSLGIDRAAFAVYDLDKDGRIDSVEFQTRYEGVLARGGAFSPPVKKPEVRKPARREAAELLEAYDQSPDGAIDARELKRALEDYSVKSPPADELLATLDRDATHKLELVELEALADVLSPKPKEEEAKPKAKSVNELFGQSVAREQHEAATQMPPHVVGPVPTFRRLDLDDDGKIEIDDLIELQRPIQLHVRVNAVFATLDRDGDGALSPEELRDSMRNKKR